MATTSLDLSRLSAFTALAESTLSTLVENPTTQLVTTLLNAVAQKAGEFEKSKSQNIKLSVELENAVRASDSKSRVLKASVDKALKEATELRDQLNTEESSKARLAIELESYKQSKSSSTAESVTLHARIHALESSCRDSQSLLDAKKRDFEEASRDLVAKHQKTIELKRELASAEQQIVSLKSSSTSASYREQTLQQNLESVQRSNEWLDQELKTKNAEFSKFRREKSARVAELQRQNEDSDASLGAAKRTEQSLRNRLDEMNQKVEDLLLQIQRMQDEATRSAENFRSELDTANHLSDLMKAKMDTERARQQELNGQLEELQASASVEMSRISTELETVHQDRLTAEGRVAELEVHLERMQEEARATPAWNKSSSTFHPTLNGNGRNTPDKVGSPARAFSPTPSRLRGGLSYTQLYGEHQVMKTALEKEKRVSADLRTTCDEMLEEMESHKPEVEELRADHDRLGVDVAELSSLVDSVGKERDEARGRARRWEDDAQGYQNESEMLRQQLRDLSAQIRVLLMEVNNHNHGLDNFTTEQRQQMEQLALGDIDNVPSSVMTDTNRFISKNLVAFRNVVDLQQQNTTLLRLTRSLGERMEGEEAKLKEAQAHSDAQELIETREKYERCQDELKSLMTRCQSYMRERDMYRRLLTNKGVVPPGTDVVALFDESNPSTPVRNGFAQSNAQSPTSKELADYAKLLKELQSNFDTYRQEAASDRSTLKTQTDNLSKDNTQLRNEVNSRKGEVALGHERYGMLQQNYSMLKNENLELKKRSQSLSEMAARQDIKVQQAAEDLVETKGFLEGLRSENANLKAEKEFWKKIEKRLTNDIHTLVGDRDRLNTLNVNLQNLLNERDHSEKGARRKLEAQVESLESDLASTRRTLNEQIEESKRFAQQREYENQQSQTKIDDLVSSVGATREELAGTKTSRDHLQARVEELTVELHNSEERLQTLQASITQSQTADQAIPTEQPSISREQELSDEVKELRQKLERSQAELSNARAQVDQYKAISQSTEEELQSLNDTQDQYRQETDALLAEKDDKLGLLQQSLDAIQGEISAINGDLASAKAEKVESDERLLEQRRAFDLETSQLKDLSDRNEAKATYCQEDLRAQAEIAQQAQQNYENELLKHAEAARNLQTLREQQSQLKLEAMELKTDAETARSTLVNGEQGWVESREQYEREIAEIKTRHRDVDAQNKILHGQLDNLNNQLAGLQQNTFNSAAQTSGNLPKYSDDSQELVRYLRREKEIVDVQYELAAQKVKRLEQQLDHTQSQLDDARLKLNQQRWAEENQERTMMTQNKLMETINELNLNRESNATLRLEKNQAQTSLAEKIATADALLAEVQTLKVQVSGLEDEKEVMIADLRMAREARERFEQRYHDLLRKSDSIDPAEFEALKGQLSILQTERDELRVQTDKFSDELKQAEDAFNTRYVDIRTRLTEQAKQRSREQANIIREKEASLKAALQEKEDLQSRLDSVKRELEEGLQAELTSERESWEARTHEYEERIAAMGIKAVEVPVAALNEEMSATKAELEQLREELETYRNNAGQKSTSEDEGQINEKAEPQNALSAQLQESLSEARERIADLEMQLATATQNVNDANAALEEIIAQQDQHQANGTNVRDFAEQPTPNDSTVEVTSTPSAQMDDSAIAAQIQAVRQELETRHEERIQAAEARYAEIFQKRSDTMKNQLNQKLKDKEAVRAALVVSHNQELQNLASEHQENIQALETRHRNEIEELKRNESCRFEEYKQHVAQSQPDRTTNGAVEGSNPAVKPIWELSEAEIKDFISKNETAKGIIRNNIRPIVNREKENMANQLKEEHRKALEDAQVKANSAKEQAVLMEGKRFGVKINMTENRARIATAKLDYVSKAAQETPQKPVVEVWDVAKTVKPAAPPPPAQSAPVQEPAAKAEVQSASSTQNTLATSNKQPPSEPQSSLPKEQPLLSSVFAQQTPAPAIPTGPSAQRPQNLVADGAQGPSITPVPTQPVNTAAAPSNPFTTTQSQQTPQQPSQQSSQQPPQQPARLPNQALQNSGIPRSTSLGSLPRQQSGLPMPSGTSIRGRGNQGGLGQSQHAPGRGGRGRGGFVPPPTTLGLDNEGGRGGSPTGRGQGLNAAARQFVPGGKRGRDDEDVGGDAATGKRMNRGGGPPNRGGGAAGN